MKIKVKVEETRVLVTDKDDNVIGIWNHAVIAEAGGLEFCIEKYKKSNPKAEIEVIGALPPETTTPAPEVTPAPAV